MSRSGTLFVLGISVYLVGFVLLGKNMSNTAPFVVVAGILLMLQAFL